MDIFLKRGTSCLLHLVLCIVIYVGVVLCFMTVYSNNTIVLIPYKRTVEEPIVCVPPSCLDGFNNADVLGTMPTAPTVALLDTGPHHTVMDESAGYLNYDVWRQMPGYLVDDMRIRSSFPNHPDATMITDTLKIVFSEEAGESHYAGKYAHKIYGFLQPTTTGYHSFGFNVTNRSALFGLELWLSNTSNPLHMRKILTADVPSQGTTPAFVAANQRRRWRKQRKDPTPPPQSPSQPPNINEFFTSEPVWLDSGTSYYMEFLEKAFDGSIAVELKWKLPDISNFASIRNNSFIPAVQLSDTDDIVQSPVAIILQGPLPSSKLQSHRRVAFVEDTVYPATDLDVLPSCNFTALYAFPRNLPEYDAHNQIFVSGMHPSGETIHWATLHNKLPPYVIKQEVIDNVIALYKAALSNSTENRGEVLQLHYMEQTVNKENGSRFLLEFGVHLEGKDEVAHTSEYVYLPHGSTQLCHTVNFEWKHYAYVYLVVTLKNLGIWTQHLIRNVEHNQKVTQDFSVELVIVDYDSSDLDVEGELSKSSLPKWHYIRKTGLFSRAGGLQAGLDYVTDPNSIVLTLDMHLAIPPGFINYARKHVIQGKMAFAPLFFRLSKGHTEVNPQGYWEPYSFGIFGMYKSDWDTIGGYNTTRYTHKWGGEDVDIADRSLEHGYEVFRIRYPGFFHYYHSRKGLWAS